MDVLAFTSVQHAAPDSRYGGQNPEMLASDGGPDTWELKLERADVKLESLMGPESPLRPWRPLPATHAAASREEPSDAQLGRATAIGGGWPMGWWGLAACCRGCDCSRCCCCCCCCWRLTRGSDGGGVGGCGAASTSAGCCQTVDPLSLSGVPALLPPGCCCRLTSCGCFTCTAAAVEPLDPSDFECATLRTASKMRRCRRLPPSSPRLERGPLKHDSIARPE
jgi:hypothetical protein